MANLAVAQALCGRGDLVLEDRLNHASLLDAGLLSGARLQRYRHLDTDDLAAKLAGRDKGEKLVLTDAVFSMDGDMAKLAALSNACAENDSWLMVDDAHGIGVLGKNGRGSLSHQSLQSRDVPIYMATLGKAFGTAGAFIAAAEDVIEYLIQTARSYIYTTAMPAALAEASRAALRQLRQDDWRREHLQALITQFKQGAAERSIELMPSDTAIQPILVGDTGRAVALSQQLFDQGILITAIRPPTVPEGTARLRVTLSAAHSKAQIDRLLDALNSIT
jgi:8-amino-7-oxononanoate synthase